jgi:hypothetical protein
MRIGDGLGDIMSPRVVESDAVTLTSTVEKTVLEASGAYTNCDIWVSVPASWLPVVLLRVYARLGAMRTTICAAYLADVPTLDAGGVLTGIAASIRGRPCTGFEVSVQAPGELPDGAATFAAQAWSGAETTTIVGGGPFGSDPIQPFEQSSRVTLLAARRAETGDLNARFGLLQATEAGLDVRLGEPGTVEGRGTPGSPTGGVVTVQGPGAGGSLTVLGTGASGAVPVVQADLFRVAPEASSFPVEGLGVAQSAAGGVLTVQGIGVNGTLLVDIEKSTTLTVTGDQAGGAHKVVGAGTAGVPSGGIVTVQGASGGVLGVGQSTAAGANGRWPVYLSDGSAAQGSASNPLNVELVSGGAAIGVLSAPLRVRQIAGDYAAFSCVTERVVSTGTTGDVRIFAALHAAASTKRIEVQRIVISFGGGAGGVVRLRATRITALTGGVALPVAPLDPANTATLAPVVVPTGSTRAAEIFALALGGAATGNYEWQPSVTSKPLVFRASTAEGVEIYSHVDTTLTTAMQVVVAMEWIEI